jgi:hypothetical protein
MTRRASARVAGAMFLAYIVIGVAELVIGRGATSGDTPAARLASIAQHGARLRVEVVLGIVICFVALTLAVSLYGVTRDEDHELAVLGLACRAGEAVLGLLSTVATIGLLSLAGGGRIAPTSPGVDAVAAFLLEVRRTNPTITATLFAIGSTIFSWLLLRGRMIPVGVAWLGVIASILLVVVLPLQLAGVFRGPLTRVVWIPMAAFEITLAFWLLIKGVAEPARRPLGGTT